MRTNPKNKSAASDFKTKGKTAKPLGGRKRNLSRGQLSEYFGVLGSVKATELLKQERESEAGIEVQREEELRRAIRKQPQKKRK